MPYGNPVGPGGSIAWIAFYTSIPLLVSHYYQKDLREDRVAVLDALQAGFALPVNETFDFIVVGAGTAGCIVARRLSEKYTVLLLEAGGEPPPVEAITTIVGYTKALEGIHWFFRSKKQTNAALGIGGESRMTAGKMLGGTGSHNDVQYERGSPHDFNNWARFTDDPSWRYKEMVRYFKLAEKYKGNFTSNEEQHEKSGMVNVASTELPFDDTLWFDAGAELGYPVRIDPNGPQRIGFSTAEYNRIKGERASTYTAYVKPVMGKRNTLTVRKFAVVSEVLIDNLKATGVRYLHHGVPRVAFASKEVILSAGAYISPVILMRSGIGPKHQLCTVGKEPLVELPAVGQNYQSHVVLDLGVTVEDKSVIRMSPNRVTFDDLEEFKTKGTGFLCARSSTQQAFLASPRAAQVDGNPEWPDIQLYFYQGYVNHTDILNCTVSLSRPRSAGRILLDQSATTLEEQLSPILDHNLFSDESDFDVMLRGIEACQRIVDTQRFQKVGAKFLEGVIPECRDHSWDHKSYWKCFMRYRAFWNVHACCTARMGPPKDTCGSVLDSKMRVKGVQGLRVIDASAFPFVTNSNINAVVMALAEKGANDVLRSWE